MSQGHPTGNIAWMCMIRLLIVDQYQPWSLATLPVHLDSEQQLEISWAIESTNQNRTWGSMQGVVGLTECMVKVSRCLSPFSYGGGIPI